MELLRKDYQEIDMKPPQLHWKDGKTCEKNAFQKMMKGKCVDLTLTLAKTPVVEAYALLTPYDYVDET
eukprot:CAMPEP_0184869430 /NCGR_PEP_ID=MMETSP0580-20130426/34025_1 /TAXON_ID=1118495 /ORGANISM="Dactyliosolen fragilissimus" /LENGTH=67 /DNA_ID=CAMNT_0027370909 /DNA_START=8 /DNA_END=211 /DNA_ORIENTATION=-